MRVRGPQRVRLLSRRATVSRIMGTLYQNAISCPRLRVAMSEDPATSSSFKWVTLPQLMNFFGVECFAAGSYMFTAKPESMAALKKELATRLGDESMQIADMYYVRMTRWAKVQPHLKTPDGLIFCEDGIKLIVVKEGGPPFDAKKWKKVISMEDMCVVCCIS